MNLSKEDIRKLILNNQLVTNYGDLDGQLTANGFDVRAAAIIEITDGGKLAVSKANNRSPKLGKAFILKGYEDKITGYDIKEKIIMEGSVKLERLKPYFIVTCEEVNTPNNIMLHAALRTSLFRLTQSILGCGFTEAGYKGYHAFMLIPILDSELELGARFAQFSFVQLTGESDYAKQKEASYQGGKLF